MGNLHSRRETEVINPAETPYIHIIPALFFTGEDKPSYRYTPALEGLRIKMGNIEGRNYDSFRQLELVEVPLLPTLVTVPPPPYNARQLVEDAIRGCFDKLHAAVENGANAFYLSHGSLWGLLPEHSLRTSLEEQGIAVLKGSFPRVGGRKRIQEHAVLIEN